MLKAIKNRERLMPRLIHLFMNDHIGDFLVEILGEFGIFFCEPALKRFDEVVELGFVIERFCHLRIEG